MFERLLCKREFQTDSIERSLMCEMATRPFCLLFGLCQKVSATRRGASIFNLTQYPLWE